MLDTIIFDLDGTLIDSLKDLQESVNYAISKWEFSLQDLDMIRCNVGDGIEKLIERSIPSGNENPNYKNCLEDFKFYYSQHCQTYTKPYDGVIEMLKRLKRDKYKIGIVSNKYDEAVKELSKKYFGDLVDVAIGQSNVTHKKPSADTVLIALKALETKPQNTIFVGDSDVDILTAQNSNINCCVSVSWGYRSIEFLKNHGAKIIINHPDEIFQYLN